MVLFLSISRMGRIEINFVCIWTVEYWVELRRGIIRLMDYIICEGKIIFIFEMEYLIKILYFIYLLYLRNRLVFAWQLIGIYRICIE